jgi:glycosyltransferase involved in cell wall biosynthesis
MQKISTIRVLWLLNYSSLRHFELSQFYKLGITEIFTPKYFPHDEGNLSASVDYSTDDRLDIPKQSLAVLNAQNWYEKPSLEAWEIANHYFDIAVIGFFPDQIKATIAYFKGSIVMRAFGLAKGFSYTRLLYDEIGVHGVEQIQRIKSRFWFGAGYDHLYECEGKLLQERHCYLPVGLKSVDIQDKWTGEDKRILFVCPRINTSPYFKNIYQQFISDFDEFNFTIAGAQPIPVNDKRVIGFVSDDIHQYNMRSHRVVFYHSSEPNHIHFHPFEAIRSGMPLIFMAGGMLDKMGGIGLWGRCKTTKEAIVKIRRILDDDTTLITAIKKEQIRLLDQIKPDYCLSYFHTAYQKIIQGLRAENEESKTIVPKKKRIAVIVPIEYRGGSLRGAISLANSLVNGAALLGDFVEVVFAHLDRPEYDLDGIFSDLSSTVIRRTYQWQVLDSDEASRALSYAGHSDWQPEQSVYWIPNDGIKQFLDCDLWIIISDRLEKPLLPIRPYVLMVYDYIQRYLPFLNNQHEIDLMQRAQKALCVLVTTQFTANDAMQYMGIPSSCVFKMPMLVPDFKSHQVKDLNKKKNQSYFIWTTNNARHKNHYNMFVALRKYYDELGGKLECHITGCNSDRIFEIYPDVELIFKSSPKMKKLMKFSGELSDYAYKNKLEQSAFLLHGALIDNGTFSVIEAAQLGIPSLSTDYPPMREISERFNLQLSWMSPTKPGEIAQQLKIMEKQYGYLKEKLIQKKVQQFKHTPDEEAYYWKVIKTCL